MKPAHNDHENDAAKEAYSAAGKEKGCQFDVNVISQPDVLAIKELSEISKSLNVRSEGP